MEEYKILKKSRAFNRLSKLNLLLDNRKKQKDNLPDLFITNFLYSAFIYLFFAGSVLFFILYSNVMSKDIISVFFKIYYSGTVFIHILLNISIVYAYLSINKKIKKLKNKKNRFHNAYIIKEDKIDAYLEELKLIEDKELAKINMKFLDYLKETKENQLHKIKKRDLKYKKEAIYNILELETEFKKKTEDIEEKYIVINE
ncbi:MAG: hypothetical protein CL760_05660 [Chloroflexi bacterium]|nr:hypothetical protein [Chloroflexota bacterium]|tara:strand:- start:3557 stop:4156 length:600 start_codon:yes stop_codon:yes gene_type:complete